MKKIIFLILATAMLLAMSVCLFSCDDETETTPKTYTVNVVAPKAEAGKRKLYTKDDVNKNGKIIAGRGHFHPPYAKPTGAG